MPQSIHFPRLQLTAVWYSSPKISRFFCSLLLNPAKTRGGCGPGALDLFDFHRRAYFFQFLFNAFGFFLRHALLYWLGHAFH